MSIYFKPTYLYIKQHSVTGKLYFGKTTRSHSGMIKYLGSGLYWKDHIKKHGKEHVVTLWYCLFYDKDDIQEFALQFSEREQIIKSDQWANLISEDGVSSTGGNSGETHHSFGKGAWGCGFKGNVPWNAGKHSGQIPWNKGKVGVQKSTTKGVRPPQISCPHCAVTGGISIMKRWHFDNCKKKAAKEAALKLPKLN